MNHSEIVSWLQEQRPQRLAGLWAQADAVRRAHVGDAVHLRGLIEISSHCARNCHYCGLRAANSSVQRYRMSAGEILDCALEAVELGYGTVVLQGGEDWAMDAAWMADVIAKIKSQTQLAVTLSLGERRDDEFALWRQAGADRYLLRFETSNRELYDRIHPPLHRIPAGDASSDAGILPARITGVSPARSTAVPVVCSMGVAPMSSTGIPPVSRTGGSPASVRDRFAILQSLREIGFEIGSGVMVGIPGQTLDDLARDVETFAALDLEMIGIGPYLPHPQTPLGESRIANCPASATAAFAAASESRVDDDNAPPATGDDSADVSIPKSEIQNPNSELLTYKMIALARIACPDANIPATTALATLNRTNGRELGLCRGANIVMPNLTPVKYRAMYEIYPAKACIYETAQQCYGCLSGRIASIGRSVGKGRGDSPRRIARQRHA